MQKKAGLIIIIIGVVLLIYKGFNIVTSEKVVDIGPIEVEKKTNHPIEWSPILGIIFLIGGAALVATNKK